MTRYVALLRGINVGGKNLIGMADLASAFTEAGFRDVSTLQQSGNVLFSASSADEDAIERMLERRFHLPIPVIVRSAKQLADIVAAAPADHSSPELRSEVIFLKPPLTAKQALADLPELREDVDAIAPGRGVLYFSRVRAQATKTRVQLLLAMPMFKQMTMRTWGTTTRILEILEAKT